MPGPLIRGCLASLRCTAIWQATPIIMQACDDPISPTRSRSKLPVPLRDGHPSTTGGSTTCGTLSSSGQSAPEARRGVDSAKLRNHLPTEAPRPTLQRRSQPNELIRGKVAVIIGRPASAGVSPQPCEEGQAPLSDIDTDGLAETVGPGKAPAPTKSDWLTRRGAGPRSPRRTRRTSAHQPGSTTRHRLQR